MRVSQFDLSPAVQRPKWYVRRLVGRPPGIAQRGPWREKRVKTTDVPRLDAMELYKSPDAKLLRRSIKPVLGRIPRHLGGGYGLSRFQMVYFAPGTKRIETLGAPVLLTPRQHVPGRRARLITARCPQCERQARYLYQVPQHDGPVCRRCGDLIYPSQARSQVARFRRRFDMALNPATRARARPIPPRWEQRLISLWQLTERRKETLESLAWYAEQRKRKRQERRERKRRLEDLKRTAKLAWSVYVGELCLRPLQDHARWTRGLLRATVARRYNLSVETHAAALAEVAAYSELVYDFPPEVLMYELRMAA